MSIPLRPILLTLIALSIGQIGRAQSSVKEFRLGGSAEILNEECIRLTPETPYVSGSAWFQNPMDLEYPFELTVDLVLGENDELGADGIVFVFHPTMQTGYRGEGMGFAGLYPSLGIEFDTYQNYHLGDPSADHVAIMPHGQAHHARSMVGPIDLPNLENGAKRPLTIAWNPGNQTLQVSLDGQTVATYTGDIINDIFGGNSKVYWGATAATGRKMNYQDVCIRKLVYAMVE
ncbi:legume-like lectin family protein [Neolewinella xylanilytica]|uniref:Legume-like lectin family protein n=1 Tax=Neolewinella xylanilytica TaxID=1514080 RepID=A0A2S6I5M4_9BACT|nr:L-type lectin-domain containing protein [Neolewinella xylanilytica]PPK86468.1 legume-like lectin family protein [Neolewinella xylanilytica]